VKGSYPKQLIPLLSITNLLDGGRGARRSQSAGALILTPASLVGHLSSQSLAEGGSIELHPERTGLVGISRLRSQTISPSVTDNCTHELGWNLVQPA
jgi:hypothetical protein